MLFYLGLFVLINANIVHESYKAEKRKYNALIFSTGRIGKPTKEEAERDRINELNRQSNDYDRIKQRFKDLGLDVNYRFFESDDGRGRISGYFIYDKEYDYNNNNKHIKFIGVEEKQELIIYLNKLDGKTF